MGDCEYECKTEKSAYLKLKKKTKAQKKKYNEKKKLWKKCKKECAGGGGASLVDRLKDASRNGLENALLGEPPAPDYFDVAPSDAESRWFWNKRFGGKKGWFWT